MSEDNSTDDRGTEIDSRPSVSALASAVISVLNDRSEDYNVSIRDAVVKKLVDASVHTGRFSAERVLSDLADSRIDNDQIVDIYVPAAARLIGDMWCEDNISFATVSIAVARLQGLLTVLAPPWSTAASEAADAMNLLLVLPKGDTHTLGPHVATAQLRRMGANVRLLFGPDTESLVDVLADDDYDLVLFSCSRPEALESIAQMVRRVRTGFNSPPPFAIGGVVLNLTDGVKEKTGVDLVTGDIRVAFKLCEKQKQKKKPLAR